MRRSHFVCSLLVMLIFTSFSTELVAQNQQSNQVGARGDDASRGSLGVRAEIQTRAYDAEPMVLDYFWVGMIFEGGAFAQFGFSLEPGYYCLRGELVDGVFSCRGSSGLIPSKDVRWQWQYWPNLFGKNFYFEIGPTHSAGENETWHQYSIEPAPNGSLIFLFDQQQVAAIAFPHQPSEEPPTVVAEKVTASNQPGPLGPVKFRNLSYLKADGWHKVDSLISIKGCGINASCDNASPYGVSLEGPNQVIAGTGGRIQRGGELLWTSSYVTLNITVHPNFHFLVTTISGGQEFTGSAKVDVPKGLFANVRIQGTSAPAEGLQGFLGVVDNFQGWNSYKSGNQSVRILMDQNKALQANWFTDYGGAARNVLIVSVLLVAMLGLIVVRFRRLTTNKEKPDAALN
jgi:hypothetical protein